MIDSMSIDVYMGKKEDQNGTIRVTGPDFCGDMTLTIQPNNDRESSIFLRPGDARLLARVLLQMAEQEGD